MDGNTRELLVLWTTDNLVTANNMVFLYTENAKIKGWWQEVTLLIWGASTRLVSENGEVRERIRAMRAQGVRVIACRKCAENLGVVERLERDGIEVFYTGEFLTEWLKAGKKLITI